MKNQLLLILMILSYQSTAFELLPSEFGKMPKVSGRITVGDINGDGYNDLISNGLLSYIIIGSCVTAYCSGILYSDPAKVWINNQQGGFSEVHQQIEFRATAEQYEDIFTFEYYEVPYSVVVDLDNDGDNDLASSSGLVFLNNGAGVFSEPLDAGYPFSNSPIFSVDLNNDNIYELIVDKYIYTRVAEQPLRYLRSSEVKLFNPKFQDMNNDGYKDAVTLDNDNNIKIWINDQAGNFPEKLAISLNEKEPFNLEVGDLDGDSNLDIILSGNRLLKNIGNLEFELTELFPSDAFSENAEVITPRKLVHFNSDDTLDLFLTIKHSQPYTTYTNLILFNDGQGGFNTIFSPNQAENSLFHLTSNLNILEDFNSDGIVDIFLSNSQILNNDYLLGMIFSELDFSDVFHQITNDFMLYLFINGSNEKIYPSSGTIINNTSEFYLFDENSDGKMELLFSNYFDLLYYQSIEDVRQVNDNHFTVSELKPDTLKVNKFNLGLDLNEFFINYNRPVDLNKDDKDDLLIEYAECESGCKTKTKVLFNSDSGFHTNNSIELSFKPRLYASGDINGDGFNDFIKLDRPDTSSNSILIQENVDSLEFIERNIQIPEFNTFIRAVLDVNNDGFDDIFFIDTSSNLYVVFGGANLHELSAKLLGSYNINKMAFYDANNDGNQDLYFILNVSKSLVHLEYNENNYTFKNIFQTTINKPLKQFYLADIDSDNTIELITLDSDSLKIYQPNQFGKYDSVFEKQRPLGTNKIILYDFDNDSKIDIALHNEVLFGRDFKFQAGLAYDPSHSGHGFSIENVGENLFFTVFYTYDNEGNPEWYSDLGVFDDSREDYWNITSVGTGLIRNEYDYVSQSVSQNTESKYKGSVEHKICSNSYGKISLDFEIGVNSFGIPISQGAWCSEPIVGYYQRPQENFSGLWWAGSDDSGWGWSISLIERDNTTDMVLVLYYYDALGNPRWLIGQQSGFVKGQEINLEMKMVKGYSRQSAPIDLVYTPSGTISLTLNEATNNLFRAGVMSIDVTYPGLEGGNWVRSNIPIALFSKPRN